SAGAGSPPRRVLKFMGTDAAADKRARLLRQLREGMAPVVAPPLLEPEPGERVPLTMGQQQMWLDSQLACDEPVYNESVTVRRTGPCHVGALRREIGRASCRERVESDGDRGRL